MLCVRVNLCVQARVCAGVCGRALLCCGVTRRRHTSHATPHPHATHTSHATPHPHTRDATPHLPHTRDATPPTSHPPPTHADLEELADSEVDGLGPLLQFYGLPLDGDWLDRKYRLKAFIGLVG